MTPTEQHQPVTMQAQMMVQAELQAESAIERPDQRGPRGNGELEPREEERAREKLERVLAQ